MEINRSDNSDLPLRRQEPGFPVGESGILQRVTNALSAEDSTREPADAWVMTYMDLITLMLTLFVLLLAYSQRQGGVSAGHQSHGRGGHRPQCD